MVHWDPVGAELFVPALQAESWRLGMAGTVLLGHSLTRCVCMRADSPRGRLQDSGPRGSAGAAGWGMADPSVHWPCSDGPFSPKNLRGSVGKCEPGSRASPQPLPALQGLAEGPFPGSELSTALPTFFLISAWARARARCRRSSCSCFCSRTFSSRSLGGRDSKRR